MRFVGTRASISTMSQQSAQPPLVGPQQPQVRPFAPLLSRASYRVHEPCRRLLVS